MLLITRNLPVTRSLAAQSTYYLSELVPVNQQRPRLALLMLFRYQHQDRLADTRHSWRCVAA
jgi:hypothetical protein